MQPLDPCSAPDFRHLVRLTDGFGILQHTKEETPLPEFGYSIDDVARALIAVLWVQRLFPDGGPHLPSHPELHTLADRYLQFLEFCQRPDGRFHNFVSYDKAFLDEAGSLDAFGRTVWALGETVALEKDPHRKERAQILLRAALPHLGALPYTRSKAFALLGLVRTLETDLKDEVRVPAHRITEDLVRAFEEAASDEWPWFEDTLRYSNAAAVYALLAVANSDVRTQDPELAKRAATHGIRALRFLLQELVTDGLPAPIGNRGWYTRGGQRAVYDQQCIDAAAMVVACVEAFRLTGEQKFRTAAQQWWEWFFGNNVNKQSLYRPEDGAVYDGLTPEGINTNRGAESVLSFVLAHLKLAEIFCKK